MHAYIDILVKSTTLKFNPSPHIKLNFWQWISEASKKLSFMWCLFFAEMQNFNESLMAQTQYIQFLFNTQQYLGSLKAPNSCFVWSMLHLTRLSHFIAQEEIPDCARWNERCKTSLIHRGNPEASSVTLLYYHCLDAPDRTWGTAVVCTVQQPSWNLIIISNRQDRKRTVEKATHTSRVTHPESCSTSVVQNFTSLTPKAPTTDSVMSQTLKGVFHTRTSGLFWLRLRLGPNTIWQWISWTSPALHKQVSF